MVKRLNPELGKLLARILVLTKARGAKQRLADELGVSRTTLSDWLRGRFEPGGEVTLKLQKWVVAAEAKHQKKTVAMLLTPQRRTTRNSKITSNEKAKSDRPEG